MVHNLLAARSLTKFVLFAEFVHYFYSIFLMIERLTLVRHGQGLHNQLVASRRDQPDYAAFLEAFNAGQSAKAAELAQAVVDNPDHTLEYTDEATPLTELGHLQSYVTGCEQGRRRREPPDLVVTSPFLRVRETYDGIRLGWPALRFVDVQIDANVGELKHGEVDDYVDWRIYSALHPDEAKRRQEEGDFAYRYLGGENMIDVINRQKTVLMRLEGETTRDVLMIGHFRQIQAMELVVGGMANAVGFARLNRQKGPPNCGVTTFIRAAGQGLMLTTRNDILYNDASIAAAEAVRKYRTT